MAENQTRKKALITIETDVGKKRFYSIEDLSKWIEKEADEWDKILQSLNTSATRNIAGKWTSTVNEILSIENSESESQDKIKKIQHLIESYLDDFEIISSKNPIVEELINCTHNIEAEGFIEGIKDKPHQNMRNDQNRLSGYIKGQIFRHQTATEYRTELRKTKNLISQWTSDYEEIASSIRETEKFHDTISNQLSQSQEQYLERLKLIKKWSNDAILGLKYNFDEFLDRANDSLNHVRDTYEKHMSLRASVDYWNNQAEEHKTKAERAFNCVILITIFTVLLFTIFGVYLLTSATPDELKMSAFSLSYGHAIKTIIFALTLSFLIWTIKLSNKTWHIHKHLQHDAKERVTMMKTYLALASEEKNLKENDVELILSSLFRPSYDGIIKDDTAPRSLADILFRDGK
jgi:uncharacterized protein (UPF0332 family)